MTPLRQRFVDDLRVRNRSPRTIERYVALVARFAKHFGRSPEVLGPDEVRAYQVHLIGQKVSWSLFNQTVCALRFLYGKTLCRPEQVAMIPFGKRPKKLPCVLSPEEVARLLDAAAPGRERVMGADDLCVRFAVGGVDAHASGGHRQQPHGGACAAGQGAEGSAGALNS